MTTPISVTQLGVWDQSPGDPLQRTHPVGIWSQGGTLLASATVLTNSPLTNSFRYVPIVPLLLTPGQTYTIGAFYPNEGADVNADQPLRAFASGFVTAPGVNFGTELFVFNSGGLTRPTSGTGLNIDPADFGPNFQFVQAQQAVPEPATLAVFGTLAAGALGLRRRFRVKASA